MIYRSPYPDVEIPDVSLPAFVLGRAGKLGGKPALIDGVTGYTLSYMELEQGVARTAASLSARGFRKGDVLAVFSPNLPEYALAFFAAAMLGGAITPVNPLFTVGELAGQLRDAGAGWLVTVPSLLEKSREAATQCDFGELFVFGEAPGVPSFHDLRTGEGSLPPSAAMVNAVKIDPRADVVALPYSSGTTGLPKGVLLTHRNLVANLCQNAAAGGFDLIGEKSTLVAVLPFFHIYGLVILLSYALYRGATLVTLPRFELGGFLEILQNHRVEFVHLVPPLVLAMARNPAVDRYDLSALQGALSAAAPLGAELSENLHRRLGCRVVQAYGLTETSPGTHLMPFPPPRGKAASVGLLLPGTEARIVDVATGEDLPPGREGELLLRGPQVMKGYLNNPQATAESLSGEGWLRTGDIASVDGEGYFYIVDRLKELIKYKGHQVAPAELEALLLTHPAVLDAAVVPSPDAEAGEVPRACIVLRDTVLGETIQSRKELAEEIKAFVAARVNPSKRIRLVDFVEEIPKSPSGKILRRVLVERR